jgi:hypothetical protein
MAKNGYGRSNLTLWEIFDDFLLLAVDPAGQDGEQELPGLEDEVHGGPDAKVGTSKASGLKEGLSSA